MMYGPLVRGTESKMNPAIPCEKFPGGGTSSDAYAVIVKSGLFKSVGT
jgi:hypothetical protein